MADKIVTKKLSAEIDKSVSHYIPNLKKLYYDEIIQGLKKVFNYSNSNI